MLRRQNHDAAAGLFDLFLGARREGVSRDGELLGHVAFAEDLDAPVASLNEARVAESLLVALAGGEALEIAHVDADGRDRERHVEAALRQAALDRSLAAPEVQLVGVSWSRT